MSRFLSTHADRPPARLLLWLGLALAATLVLGAGRAGAEITTTHITSPADKTYGIYATHQVEPPFEVKGTTDSTDTGTDTVNIYCVGNGAETKVATRVPLSADGSFSAEIAPSEISGVCRLRALPAEQLESARDPHFAGPTTAIGSATRYAVEQGREAGRQYDYRFRNSQLGGEDELESAGSCGLRYSVLIEEELEPTTFGFGCSDYFWKVADEAEEADSRSEIQVDGVNAYLPASARDINEEGLGLPGVVWKYHQNPFDGDLTVEEVEALETCNGSAFPPTEESCDEFIPSGVVDNRTIETNEEGRLVTITDHYSSSDHVAHTIDTLNQQDAIFGLPLGRQEPLGFRFPGESGYSTHSVGDVVSLPGASGANVIYIRRENTPDGDKSTGRGAIVYDRPASSATFNLEDNGEVGFYLHQTATVPASGVTTVRFAYAMGYDQAQVEALANQAVASFGGPAQQPGPTGTGAPGAGGAGSTSGGTGTPSGGGGAPKTSPGPSSHPGTIPSGRITFGRVETDRGTGTANLTVMAPGPGRLTLSGHGLRTVRRRVAGAGPVLVPIDPTASLAATLRKRGHAKVALKVAFTPVGGSPTSWTRQLVLVHASH